MGTRGPRAAKRPLNELERLALERLVAREPHEQGERFANLWGHVERGCGQPTTLERVRAALDQLRVRGLARCDGHGAAARWRANLTQARAALAPEVAP